MRAPRCASFLAAAVSCLTATTASASDEVLMERGGCISCHRVDQKLIGPAFADVAKRYRGDAAAAARLFSKVREGGDGEWGDMPMQPNGPEKITDEDLKAVLAWILQL